MLPSNSEPLAKYNSAHNLVFALVSFLKFHLLSNIDFFFRQQIKLTYGTSDKEDLLII